MPVRPGQRYRHGWIPIGPADAGIADRLNGGGKLSPQVPEELHMLQAIAGWTHSDNAPPGSPASLGIAQAMANPGADTHAAAFVRAVAAAPPNAPRLFRGQRAHSRGDVPAAGDTMDLGPTSFSRSRGIADEFATLGLDQTGIDRHTIVIMEVEESSRALGIEEYAGEYADQEEYVGLGRYEVVGRKDSTTTVDYQGAKHAIPVAVLQLRQVDLTDAPASFAGGRVAAADAGVGSVERIGKLRRALLGPPYAGSFAELREEVALPIIAKEYQESDDQNQKHPHAPAGTSSGGQFTKNKGTGTKPPAKAPAKKRAPAKRPAPKAAPAAPAARAPGPPGSARLNLKRGGQNDAAGVRNLQALLAGLGAKVALDGQYGPDTEAAVKAAQAKLGMKPTGRASSSLIRRMADAHALSPCVGGKVSASVVVVAADGETHSGAMIALVPSEEDAQRLEVDEGEPADELHCTLVYLGDAADFTPAERAQLIATVSAAVAGMGAVEADGFAIGMFNPAGSDPCVVLGLSGAELADAKSLVDDAVDGVDLPEQHEPWIPHVTLEYTDDPSVVAEYVDQTGPITFDRVRVAFGGDVTDIELDAGAPVTAAAGADTTAGHDELHHYWVAGAGLARWRASPTPWTTLVTLLSEHVGPAKAKIFASKWHKEVFGIWVGEKAGKNPAGPG